MAFSVPALDWLDFPSAVRLVALVAPELNASDVRAALLRAAEDGQLDIRYAPMFLERGWRQYSEPDDSLWTDGVFALPIGPDGRMTIIAPEIRRATLIALFTADVGAKQSSDASPTTAGAPPPGPKPLLRERVEDAMRATLARGEMTLRDLTALGQKELAAKFGVKAGRTTCVDARKKVLSEFAGV